MSWNANNTVWSNSATRGSNDDSLTYLGNGQWRFTTRDMGYDGDEFAASVSVNWGDGSSSSATGEDEENLDHTYGAGINSVTLVATYDIEVADGNGTITIEIPEVNPGQEPPAGLTVAVDGLTVTAILNNKWTGRNVNVPHSSIGVWINWGDDSEFVNFGTTLIDSTPERVSREYGNNSFSSGNCTGGAGCRQGVWPSDTRFTTDPSFPGLNPFYRWHGTMALIDGTGQGEEWSNTSGGGIWTATHTYTTAGDFDIHAGWLDAGEQDGGSDDKYSHNHVGYHAIATVDATLDSVSQHVFVAKAMSETNQVLDTDITTFNITRQVEPEPEPEPFSPVKCFETTVHEPGSGFTSIQDIMALFGSYGYFAEGDYAYGTNIYFGSGDKPAGELDADGRLIRICGYSANIDYDEDDDGPSDASVYILQDPLELWVKSGGRWANGPGWGKNFPFSNPGPDFGNRTYAYFTWTPSSSESQQ